MTSLGYERNSYDNCVFNRIDNGIVARYVRFIISCDNRYTNSKRGRPAHYQYERGHDRVTH
jgi:hypothetical protein